MDLQKLQGVVPDEIYNQLQDTCSAFDIDGPLRLSHLLGQCKLESGNFTHLVENLNYSGDALMKLFHSHFTDQADADSYNRQPERIANRIYANRMGNGDEASGDGWMFRGRGCIQSTGRDNYQEFGDSIGVDLISSPDLVATDYSLLSAAFFFKSNDLWAICDKGIDVATITIITRHVNGGENGLSDRIQYTQEFHQILTA